MQLLVATQNPGKKTEIREFLKGLFLELLFLDDLDLNGFVFPEESGLTFQENALIKARSLLKYTGIATIADDSGLSVDTLDGFPGVKSARWLEGSDQDRINGLLKKLENQVNRKASFVCSICLCQPNLAPYYFDGVQHGHISEEPKGSNGFGYDPIFIPDGETHTYAELGIEYKNNYSHRAEALNKLAKFLKYSMVD